jgi:hypothetical protein
MPTPLNLFPLTLLLTAAVAFGQPGTTKPSVPREFDRKLAGTVGDQAVVVSLAAKGSALTGSYEYARVGRRLGLKGTRTTSEDVTIEEVDPEGRVSGVFKGSIAAFRKGDDTCLSVTGTWSRRDGSGRLRFELYEELNVAGGFRLAVKPRTRQALRRTAVAAVPVLYGAPAERAAAFNRTADSLIEDKMAQVFEGDPPPEGSREEFSSSFMVMRAATDLLSIRFTFWEYGGGAHGNYYFTGLTYDPVRGRVMKLADLFSPNAEYLPVVADLCFADLKSQLPDSDEAWIRKGTRPDPEFYEIAWSLTGQGLRITFPPYLVAGYADGSPDVDLPYEKLKSIAPSGGVLARLASSSPGPR